MASRSVTRVCAPLLRHAGIRSLPPRIPSSRLFEALPQRSSLAAVCLRQQRHAHTIPQPPKRQAAPSSESPSTSEKKDEKRPHVESQPHYRLSFTCGPCNHPSTHTISKQGYHRGSVLVTCPSCRNRHVISDHLGIFGDRKVTIEDIMREKGQLVKKGTLGEDGDIEFWEEEKPSESDDFKFGAESKS